MGIGETGWVGGDDNRSGFMVEEVRVRVGVCGDATPSTPCRMTGVTLHGGVSPEGRVWGKPVG